MGANTSPYSKNKIKFKLNLFNMEQVETTIEESTLGEMELYRRAVEESPDLNGAGHDDGLVEDLEFSDKDFQESFLNEEVVEHFNRWSQGLGSDVGNILLFQEIYEAYCQDFFYNVHDHVGLPPFSFAHFTLSMGLPVHQLTTIQVARLLVKDKASGPSLASNQLEIATS